MSRRPAPPFLVQYRAYALDERGAYVPDPVWGDMILESHPRTLGAAVRWALAFFDDERVRRVTVVESVKRQPGHTWKAGRGVLNVQREHPGGHASAVALVADVVVRAHLAGYAGMPAQHVAIGYRAVLDSLVCLPAGERRVVAHTDAPAPDEAELHAHVGADVLDLAHSALYGSPYAVPDTAVIGRIGARTWEMTW